MKNNKTVSAGIFGILIIFIININVAIAGPLTQDVTADQVNAFNKTAGYSQTTTLGSMVATIVKAFLGLLGIILIYLIVLSGYNWMTAAGDEQKVTKAKDTLRAAVIGLIIIIAAYSITYFVLQALGNTAGGGGGGGLTGGP